MPTCQLIKSLLDSNEDFLDWQTPRLEKHEIDCDGPSNGQLRQNGAPDYESGGQEFESLRARQEAIAATHNIPKVYSGNFAIAICIATISPRYGIAKRCCKSLKCNENVCSHRNKQTAVRESKDVDSV
jgi:hypothetical protein